ncbi:MAG: hypothetical protein EXS08_16285 [Planctomycetes bacterium]|nr:hypothetical protein [Planctomycetota bacterium]
MKRLAPLLPVLTCLALTATPAQAQWSQDTLSVARKALASASDGQRAYFAGGRRAQHNSVRSTRVDVFDTATQTWSQSSLSVARSELAATAVWPYVIFAGGSLNATIPSAVVDVLDTRTMTWSTTTLSQARSVLAATTVGTKAIFAGGNAGSLSAPVVSDVIDVYDSALGEPGDPQAWSTAQLSVARGQMAAATVGTRALFAGGIDTTSALAMVDIFDDSTGTWSTANLSQARMLEQHSAATAGGRVYFAGGAIDQALTLSDVVDVFDSATDTWTTLTLSVPRGSLSVEAVGDLVLFAGGVVLTPGFDSSDVVDVLQASTGTWLPPSHLSLKRHNLAAAAAGDQVLFAGGDELGNVVSNVDVLTCPSATSAVYAGRGLNADTITLVDMVLGEPWSAPLAIGHDHGSGGLLMLEVRTGILDPLRNVLPVGRRRTERLITGPLLFSATGSHDGSSGDVPPIIIPMDLLLVGASWAAQYRVVGGGFVDLSQAVFGVVGCR